jgi:hypothetical protein
MLNVSLMILNGRDAGRKIEAELSETAIVILSFNPDEHFIQKGREIAARALRRQK